MIVPIVSDASWKARLEVLPAWNPPQTRTVILSPHPDDETLGAGGLIWELRRRQVDVLVIAVTDGESAYPGENDLGRIRREEQENALRCLGVAPGALVRFNFPDRYVAEHEDLLVQGLLPFVDQDTHLVSPWTGDFHPDHEASGRAAERVAKTTGALLSFYFFWTWHRGTLEVLDNLPLHALRLGSPALDAKANAIRKHRSQLVRAPGDPILSGELLAPTHWPFEVYAAA